MPGASLWAVRGLHILLAPAHPHQDDNDFTAVLRAAAGAVFWFSRTTISTGAAPGTCWPKEIVETETTLLENSHYTVRFFSSFFLLYMHTFFLCLGDRRRAKLVKTNKRQLNMQLPGRRTKRMSYFYGIFILLFWNSSNARGNAETILHHSVR